jgi:hypothetical protein
MSISFPTSLDTLTNPTPTDYLDSPSHSGQHSDANDAIEALEAKVGIDGSADTDSLDYKITTKQDILSEGAFVDGDKSKLDGIEAGANVTDAGNIASSINGVDAKTAPHDNDLVGLVDSQASNVLKKLSWANIKATITLLVYPIGSVYISVGSTSPAILFGGTWSVFGAGKCLVGIDSADTDFDTVEETRGAKTHTLTTAEMPEHTHTQNAHTHIQNAHAHEVNGSGGTDNANNNSYVRTDNNGGYTPPTTPITATNQNTTATNQNAGSGSAHNNIQPSIVVRMWKRTA